VFSVFVVVVVVGEAVVVGVGRSIGGRPFVEKLGHSFVAGEFLALGQLGEVGQQLGRGIVGVALVLWVRYQRRWNLVGIGLGLGIPWIACSGKVVLVGVSLK